ncbi:MAG TPA: heterodisulfide reductase-related iron-sulfur binding cluster [Coriobacteriia bacterium]|nr:heterodisulfide reductase-related iron-sulfur binding cluster [Coriobacteriia bacterium]
MREFAVFWGCTIPARFPFIEKATRLVLDDLGVRVRELEGHTCCPEGVLVKAGDERTFYATAARNLALAERAGLDMVTPCSGCYSTFKEAQNHVRTEWREHQEINERLSAEGLRHTGSKRVLHLAEWLADEVGTGPIASKAVRPLWGMRIAVHYGCHLLRPQPAVRWDDPLHPVKVEELVAALGARVVDYPAKMQCCGQALDRVGERDSSLAFARRKLLDVQREEVDALVVVCPSCFQQFDLNQAALRRANEGIEVPVLYLSELIALAYGHEPSDIGLDMHRVPVDSFLERWGARAADKARLAEHFDVALLGACYACQACKDDCPVCRIDPAFQPTEIIGDLVRGHYDDVVATTQLWKCLECYTCQELCHSDIGMAQTFRRLKELAMAAGNAPEQVRTAYQTFLETGALGTPKEGARRRLGLPPLPASGGDAVVRLCDSGTTTEGV